MKKEVIIKKKIKNLNKNNVISYYVDRHLNNILKCLLEVKGEIKIENIKDNEYVVFEQEKIICNFLINNNFSISCFSIKILKDNILYDYYIEENQGIFVAKLKSYIFTKDKTNYTVFNYGTDILVDIKSNDKGIVLELEESKKETSDTINFITNLSFEDNIENIYNKINKLNRKINNLKIKKYNILNTYDSKEIMTDLIIINNGQLIDYLTTIEKENKKYIIKKEGNNCSLTLINSSIDGLTSSYFEVNDRVKFIKKLEKKK